MWKYGVCTAGIVSWLMLVGLLAACNDGETRVTVPITGTPVDPTGTWTLAPQPSYSCASGIVSFNIASFNFTDAGGGAMNVSGAPYTMAGALPINTGQPIDVTFSTTIPEPTCNETYALSAGFSSVNAWSGTFVARFSGTQCDDFPPTCTDQTFSVSGSR